MVCRTTCASGGKCAGEQGEVEKKIRGVQEELGSAVPDGQSLEVDVDAASYARSETSRVSSSYPGLMSHYVCHEVAARVRPLPQEDFETREPRPGGFLVTSWAWKRPGPRRRGPPRPPP